MGERRRKAWRENGNGGECAIVTRPLYRGIILAPTMKKKKNVVSQGGASTRQLGDRRSMSIDAVFAVDTGGGIISKYRRHSISGEIGAEAWRRSAAITGGNYHL